MEEHMEDWGLLGHRPIDVLELQITTTTLQNEVLMRYVTSPANLQKIRDILEDAFKKLGKLYVAKPMVKCPTDWIHVMCRCVTPTIEGQSYKKDKKEKSHGHPVEVARKRGRAMPGAGDGAGH
jgi:hypothetical protein